MVDIPNRVVVDNFVADYLGLDTSLLPFNKANDTYA
jgi:hypothetical protein